MKNEKPDLRRLRSGLMSTVLTAVCIVCLIALNLLFTTLEKKYALRTDLSFNAFSTYGEVTAEVLAELDTPVHIYALYTRGEEDQPLLELLDRYAAASSMVTWEQTDISLNPGLISRFTDTVSGDTVSNDTLVVWCEKTGRWKILNALDFISLSYNDSTGEYEYTGQTYESSLTSAIRYVSQEQVPRVMILQGHGELSEDGTAVLASFLDGNSYDVYYFTLSSSEAALSPDDLLVILSPVRDLTDTETEKVAEFVKAGGAILFTCDYTDPVEQMPNYSALLRSYGFIPETGAVIAAVGDSAACYNGNRAILIPEMQETEITQDLIEGRDTFLILAGTRGFTMPQDGERYLQTQAVLTSGAGSYARNFSESSSSLSQQEGEPDGPFALALQAQRMTETGDISRAFAVGCSSLLTSEDEYAITVSQQFILRTVEWLLGRQSTNLNIMARAAVRPGLSMASAGMGSLIIVLLPMLVLGAAVAVLMWRRHK